MTKSKGLLIILSGPSGVGKGTICRSLCRENDTIVCATSLTTRTPRRGEQDGVDYFFVDEKKFCELKDQGSFLEWAEVHGNLYATLTGEVERLRQKECDVILEIDVQGAAQVRRSTDEGICIFLLPPNMEELWQRIEGRGTDKPEAMQERFRNARRELMEVWQYDYVVINNTVSEAVNDIKSIIMAEKCRVERNKQFLKSFVGKGDGH
ncbi:MAG: guanylate kinase [Dethiobacteria bacterium]|jgi:guanylate kinase